MELSTAEFNNQNYGGALYLASRVKQLARAGESGPLDQLGELRPDETVLAVPLPLAVASRANVRAGPGTGFAVLYLLEKDAPITAYSYVTDWLRITDADGRPGWIFRTLTERRQTGG
jgi:hypothetical protein